MAIYHFSQKIIARAAGRNAVNCAAYRRGARLLDSASGETFDYTRKEGVEHSELTVPANAPAWLKEISARDDSAALWSAVEAHEKRKDAQLAREIELALPRELDLEQQIALVREFVGEQLAERGMVADWSVHNPSNGENPHVHIMLTTRPVTEHGFGPRSVPVLNPKTGEHLRDGKGRLRYRFGDVWGSVETLNQLRANWADAQNQHLTRAGHDVRVDHRSLEAQGLALMPTSHVGPHASNMVERGKKSDRADLCEEERRANAEEIARHPEKVLEAITARKAVFTSNDIAREVGRWIDEPATYQAVVARVQASGQLVQLCEEKRTASGWVLQEARYSTQAIIEGEARMLEAAEALAGTRAHGVNGRALAKALEHHPQLSEEQRAAVGHVVAEGSLATVAGFAGAGKSSALAAAREAWEAQGYRVVGAALAGKAADGLSESAGIKASTIHALEYGWEKGKDKLDRRTVLVIDEAGMVGSLQLGRVLAEARRAEAKVVLVGDAQQLQPIEAGAPFRAIAERIGVAEIATIRRQKDEWARQASQALAQGRVREALGAYAEHGGMRWAESRSEAKAELARRWMAERDAKRSAIILAHTNEDVRDLNLAVRGARRAAGELGPDARFATANGEREFAARDRVVFLQNNRELGVKNGTLGTVERAEDGRLVVKLDSGRSVDVHEGSYGALEHGYAVTIHKAQGVTVDRAYLLASGGMDRHLAYVGMTRHREQLAVYAGRDDFRGEEALAARLGRARPKASSLDFAERRGMDSVRAYVENAKAPPPAAHTQALEKQWSAAVEAERGGIQQQAARLEPKAKRQHATVLRRAEAHDQAEPRPRFGLKTSGWEKAHALWVRARDALARRAQQLVGRVSFLGSIASDDVTGRARRLAERRAEWNNPALAAELREQRAASREAQAAEEMRRFREKDRERQDKDKGLSR